MIELIIPGEPIAKKRPRFAKRGKFVQTYNDQETEEGKFITQVLHQIDGNKPLDCPLHIEFFFYRSRPKGHYGTGKNAEKLKPSAPEWPTSKPDVDNYEKFALDCMNDIVFRDDSQVVSMKSIKAYAREPKTIIQVMAI